MSKDILNIIAENTRQRYELIMKEKPYTAVKAEALSLKKAALSLKRQ